MGITTLNIRRSEVRRKKTDKFTLEVFDPTACKKKSLKQLGTQARLVQFTSLPSRWLTLPSIQPLDSVQTAKATLILNNPLLLRNVSYILFLVFALTHCSTTLYYTNIRFCSPASHTNLRPIATTTDLLELARISKPMEEVLLVIELACLFITPFKLVDHCSNTYRRVWCEAKGNETGWYEHQSF